MGGKVKQLTEDLIKFRDDRGWGEFHTIGNLSYSLACEVGELLQLWQWGKEPHIERVAEEVADVAIYALYLIERFKEPFPRLNVPSEMGIDPVAEVKFMHILAGNGLKLKYGNTWARAILVSCGDIAGRYGLDLETIIRAKMIKNAIKYPIDAHHAAEHGWAEPLAEVS